MFISNTYRSFQTDLFLSMKQNNQKANHLSLKFQAQTDLRRVVDIDQSEDRIQRQMELRITFNEHSVEIQITIRFRSLTILTAFHLFCTVFKYAWKIRHINTFHSSRLFNPQTVGVTVLTSYLMQSVHKIVIRFQQVLHCLESNDRLII